MLERHSLAADSLHNWSSLISHIQRFVGVGKMSYTDLMSYSGFFSIPFTRARPMVVFCSNRFPSKPTSFFFLIATALVIRVCSSPCGTSSLTSYIWRCFDAELNLLLVIHPSQSRPCVSVPTKSLVLVLSSYNYFDFTD